MAKKKPVRARTEPATIAKIRKMKAEGARVADIVAACKVSKATVYTYTKSVKAVKVSSKVARMNEALVETNTSPASGIQEILEAAARLNLQIIIINGRVN